MIVDPDFLDHWRTRMLVDLLGGDELAPMYVIRVWGHCQTRRATEFEVPPAGLKAICRAPHDAAMFEQAMIEAGFIERAGALLRVPKWADHNAAIVRSWNREGRELDVAQSEWLRLRTAIFERDGYRCVYCGNDDKSLDCDHVKPLSKGGKSAPENLATACYSCNRSKGAKTLEEWGRFNGR